MRSADTENRTFGDTTHKTRTQNVCAQALHEVAGWIAPLVEEWPSGLCGKHSHQPVQVQVFITQNKVKRYEHL